MKKILLLFTGYIFYTNSYGQDQPLLEFPKNVIHASIGTFGYVNSAQISYNRLLTKKENGFFKAYYLSFKAGGNATLDFSGARSGTGYVTSIGATGLTGKGKHHFETSLGLGYFIDTVETFDSDVPVNDNDESTFYPSISIGYRKQTSKGFMIRTGVGIVEWAYVGFGYSF